MQVPRYQGVAGDYQKAPPWAQPAREGGEWGSDDAYREPMTFGCDAHAHAVCIRIYVHGNTVSLCFTTTDLDTRLLISVNQAVIFDRASSRLCASEPVVLRT